MASPTRSPQSTISVLFGGGIESTALVRQFLDAGKSVIPVRIHCGLIWDDCESDFARRFLAENSCDRLAPLREVRLPLNDFLGDHWAVTGRNIPQSGSAASELEIPLRNLTLLSFAFHQVRDLPGASLALGTTADNCYRDGSREYFDRCEEVLGLEAGYAVPILTPLIHLNKTQVIQQSDAATLALSFSCVNPGAGRHCGECIKCGRRKASFRAAGVSDPTDYAA
jgi:7-cyano-7-deazaguanine synthase